jgi:hypothetical protein
MGWLARTSQRLTEAFRIDGGGCYVADVVVIPQDIRYVQLVYEGEAVTKLLRCCHGCGSERVCRKACDGGRVREEPALQWALECGICLRVCMHVGCGVERCELRFRNSRSRSRTVQSRFWVPLLGLIPFLCSRRVGPMISYGHVIFQRPRLDHSCGLVASEKTRAPHVPYEASMYPVQTSGGTSGTSP